MIKESVVERERERERERETSGFVPSEKVNKSKFGRNKTKRFRTRRIGDRGTSEQFNLKQ
jgi:hypothetical protein